ncbi:MFS transporter [Streptomyces durbertensis]|uniref:MFS transporter n=1 Tax=Streptomyces durbertensis TaxID=2448886 RepID=A0ABR6ED68_9ACTN|nr:MFS transporter [Streptomyces durbertensis]MBB1243276.1 MFS transporter [Streptomyces durbertensis]
MRTTTREPSGDRAVLALMLLVSTLAVMAGAVLAPVLEVIRGELGVSGTAVGLVLTVHALVVAVVSPAVGAVIDRVGVRTPLAAGLVLYGLAGGAGLVTDSYPALIAGRVVFGMGAATVFTATTVAMLALYRGSARDRVMGWRSAAMSLGGVAWPLLAGVVGGLSWHAPFALYLVGVPLGVAVWWVMPAGRLTGTDTPPGPSEGTLAMLRRAPAVLGWSALLGAVSVLLYALVVFMPLRLAELGVTAPLLVALMNMASTLAMMVVGFGYARLRGRFGYLTILRAAVVLWGAAFVLLGLTSSLFLAVVAMALFGLGAGVVMPTATVLLGDGAPAGQQGRAVALSGTAVFAGQFASPLLLGPVVDRLSVQAGYLTAAAFSALVLAALTVLTRRRRTPRHGGADCPRTPPHQAAAPNTPGLGLR